MQNGRATLRWDLGQEVVIVISIGIGIVFMLVLVHISRRGHVAQDTRICRADGPRTWFPMERRRRCVRAFGRLEGKKK
jgi:hypothetical protein